jgi:hypothetical protein
MKKKILLAIVIGLVAIGGSGAWYWAHNNPNTLGGPGVVSTSTENMLVEFTPRNGTYNIDGKMVSLKDGVAEITVAPGSASKEIIRYFDGTAPADLNNDGVLESVVILEQVSAGTGSFFYTALTKKTATGFVSDKAEFMGDRIAIQNINFDKETSKIVVNYADRKTDEPMSARPSIGVSRYYTVENGELKEDLKTYASFSCILNNGKWLPSTGECEFGLDKDTCVKYGGEFNECASACRNAATSTKPTVCTRQCVAVCKIK